MAPPRVRAYNVHMPAKDVDAYLAKLSPDKRTTLEKVRQALRAAAPGAEEGIRYGMPAIIQGEPVAGYGAGANHCAYYPMSGGIVSALEADLARYDTSKGAIRFPIGKPLSAALIRKLVKARLSEIAAGPPKKSTAKRAAGKAVRAEQTDAAVITYLRALEHPLKKEIEAVRLAILEVSPAIREGIKWNAPSFRTDTEYFATFNLREKDSIRLILHLGAKTKPGLRAFEIADPRGLLKWLGKDRALVTLGAARTIASNRPALKAIVRAWMKHVG